MITQRQLRRDEEIFRRLVGARGIETGPLFGFSGPEDLGATDQTTDQGSPDVGAAPRRRLISGIDEEGFYHGAEAEIESNEGVASDYWGNSGRNSINLGEEGYYE